MSIITVPQIVYPPFRSNASFYADAWTFDAAEELLAIVMKVPKTGTLNKIGWVTGNTFTASGYTMKVSLETVSDTAGQPVATTNAGKTLYATGAESADITSGLAANTVSFTPINGSTGISVTVNEYIAITFRMTAITSGSLSMMYQQYQQPSELLNFNSLNTYNAGYAASAWSIRFGIPIITIEYSDGFIAVPYLNPVSVLTSNVWNGSSNPDRRGAKFRLPYTARAYGAMINLTPGNTDVDVILYDSDEYTVMSGFPITISCTKKASTAANDAIIPFPTKPTLNANSWYRLVLLPKHSSNNVTFATIDPADDGSYDGVTAFTEGADFVYTTFNGAPSSGSHSWTDSNVKPRMSILLDGIDTGSAGGLLRHPGMQGGLNA